MRLTACSSPNNQNYAIMNKDLLARLKEGAELLPTCLDYANLLDYAHIITGMNYHGLRKAMGLATYKQWAFFLNVA